MRMHEFFAGLKPISTYGGVAGVSGVAPCGNTVNGHIPDKTVERNTGCNTSAQGVIKGVSIDVAVRGKAYGGIASYETLATPETPYLEEWQDYWREQFEERAAIMEFDGGMPRNKAELAAYENVILVNFRERRRTV